MTAQDGNPDARRQNAALPRSGRAIGGTRRRRERPDRQCCQRRRTDLARATGSQLGRLLFPQRVRNWCWARFRASPPACASRSAMASAARRRPAGRRCWCRMSTNFRAISPAIPKSRSELVVPLIEGGEVLGVLDLDSPLAGRFDEADREGCERLVALFAAHHRGGATGADDIDPQSGCRLPLPRREDLDEEGRRTYDRLSDPTGGSLRGLRGPGGIQLHSPELSRRSAPVNRYLRHEAGLGGRVRELAILVTAREVDNAFEWAAHEPEALAEGVPREIVDIVRYRGETAGLAEADAVVIELGARDLRPAPGGLADIRPRATALRPAQARRPRRTDGQLRRYGGTAHRLRHAARPRPGAAAAAAVTVSGNPLLRDTGANLALDRGNASRQISAALSHRDRPVSPDLSGREQASASSAASCEDTARDGRAVFEPAPGIACCFRSGFAAIGIPLPAARLWPLPMAFPYDENMAIIAPPSWWKAAGLQPRPSP